MANIKRVLIEGTLPFDMGENDDLIRLLGQFNMPAIGLRIKWTGSGGMKPNKFGGQTAMYKFRLEGEEAVSYDYLRRFVRLVYEVFGTVDKATATDIEDRGSRPVNLL